MGFRSGAYATVWSIESVSPTFTKGRISISRKNKETGSYDQDFGGYVAYVGSACAAKALRLKEKDRIRLGDVDVTTVYKKDKDVTYTDFKVFNFKVVDNSNGASSSNSSVENTVDSNDVEEEDDLPF